MLEKSKLEISKIDDAPLFTEDQKEDPGNHCLLSKEEALLFSLFRKHGNATQSHLAMLFGIDQTTVSRYLKFMDVILSEFLPTAENMTKKIKEAKTIKEFEEIIPNSELLIDGTEVQVQRPTNKLDRKSRYSGKKKRHTFNNTMITNNKKIIIYKGKTFDGSANDIGMIRDDPINFGRWNESLLKNNGHKIIIRVDKGYQSIEKYLLGVIVEIPTKKPKNGELTPEQNKEYSKNRIPVEHAFADMKIFEIMKGPYDGTKEDFEREIQVVIGLSNLRKLWDPGKRRPTIEF